jgi:hypothetical protein
MLLMRRTSAPLALEFSSGGSRMRRLIFLMALLATPALAGPIQAQAPGDEAAVRALIGEWYDAHRAGTEGAPWRLHAPGAIDASPSYRHVDTGAAVLGPRVYSSLAATSLLFEYEITRLVLDPRFARVDVRERGYSYAWAVQRTYERMGSAVFVLERQEDGRWLVLAHETNTIGFPPSLATNPMPDLRDLYYATEGHERDSEADARNAENRSW